MTRTKERPLFKLDADADVDGTCLIGEIDISPVRLIKAFGDPPISDGEKTSGEYNFTDDNGAVFTIYDYKATTVYDPELMRPSELWASDEPFDFHVGGNDEAHARVDEFIDWLQEHVQSELAQPVPGEENLDISGDPVGDEVKQALAAGKLSELRDKLDVRENLKDVGLDPETLKG